MSKALDSAAIFPEWVTQETKHNPDPLFTAYQALTHWHRSNVCRQLETILNQTSVDMKDDEREEWLERTKVAPQFVKMEMRGHSDKYYESIEWCAKVVLTWLTNITTKYSKWNVFVTERDYEPYHLWCDSMYGLDYLHNPTFQDIVTAITAERQLNVQYKDESDTKDEYSCHYTRCTFQILKMNRKLGGVYMYQNR
jgi:hypothetical protein